jgi:hypothetical protein
MIQYQLRNSHEVSQARGFIQDLIFQEDETTDILSVLITKYPENTQNMPFPSIRRTKAEMRDCTSVKRMQR